MTLWIKITDDTYGKWPVHAMFLLCTRNVMPCGQGNFSLQRIPRDDGSIHDWDNVYSWADAFAVHIAGLNAGAGFAGHTDWRLPNVKELQSIVNYQNFNPAVSPAFNTGCVASCTVLTCSCTATNIYRSYTTEAGFSSAAWCVGFPDGSVFSLVKSISLRVRAVRGGR